MGGRGGKKAQPGASGDFGPVQAETLQCTEGSRHKQSSSSSLPALCAYTGLP